MSILRFLFSSRPGTVPDLASLINAQKESGFFRTFEAQVIEEPEQRFASVGDLSEDVRRYLEGLPILAREQTLWYRAGKFVNRHGPGVTAFALLTFAVAGGIMAVVWESRKAERERQQAERRLSQAVELANRKLADVNESIGQAPGTMEARERIVRGTPGISTVWQRTPETIRAS